LGEHTWPSDVQGFLQAKERPKADECITGWLYSLAYRLARKVYVGDNPVLEDGTTALSSRFMGTNVKK
jgi:hypothetical protein